MSATTKYIFASLFIQTFLITVLVNAVTSATAGELQSVTPTWIVAAPTRQASKYSKGRQLAGFLWKKCLHSVSYVFRIF